MSRRARARGDKRDRFAAEPSPGLAAALDAIETPQLPKADLVDPDVIVTHQGVRVDLRKPWPFPSNPAR